jgi:hypothetical protein
MTFKAVCLAERSMLHDGRASFDKLRMRNIGKGIDQKPRRKDLILSLSKDARAKYSEASEGELP